MLVKTGAWYHGGMAKPVQLDVDTGSDTSSIKAEHSPPHEKKARIYDRERQHPDSGQSSEKENIAQTPSQQRDRDRDRGDGKAPLSRSGSVLKRQYSMSDANMGKGSSGVRSDRTNDRQGDQQDSRLRDRTDPRGVGGDSRARSYDPSDPRDHRMRHGDPRHDMASSQSQGEYRGTDPRSAQDLRGRRPGGGDPHDSQRHRHPGDMQEGAQHSTRAENRVDSKHDRHYSDDQFQSERYSAERDRSRLERRSSVERRQDLNHSDSRQRDRDSRERDRSHDHASDRSHTRDTSPHRGDPHSVRDRPPSRERYARDDPRRSRDDSRHR